jgi:hypothetical protein
MHLYPEPELYVNDQFHITAAFSLVKDPVICIANHFASSQREF